MSLDEVVPLPPPPGLPVELERAALGRAVPVRGGVATPPDVLPSAALPARRPNATATATATREQPTPSKPLDESHEAAVKRAAANTTASRSQSVANSTASGPSFDSNSEIDLDLKEAAKTAREWIREGARWIQPARSRAANGGYQESESADWPTPERERGAAGPQGTVTLEPAPSGEYPQTSERRFPSGQPTMMGEINLIQEGIKVVRELAEHPITWLLIPLVALGGVVMWMMGHTSTSSRLRPKHARSRATRRKPTRQRTAGRT